MKSFRRFFSIVLIIAVAAGLVFAGGKQEQKPSAPAPKAAATSGPFAGVKPLEKPTTLKLGHLNGSHHGVISYFIEKLGGFDQVGIKTEWAVFGNGPVMVEAMSSGGRDCGTYGIGGTLSGGIGRGALVLGSAARDSGSFRFFVPKDSDIVKAGKGHVAGIPELWGTAETWKGKEIYLPTGTTLHYALNKGLEKFGLTAKDVKLTHMDVTSVNTALMAGRGQVGALWGNFSYSKAINDKYVAAMKGQDVGVELVTVIAANPKSYADPVLGPAVKKYVELYYKTVEWLWDGEQLRKENKEQAFNWYIEWNEKYGVKTNRDELEPYLTENRHYTLADNYKFFTSKVKATDGKEMNTNELFNYEPLLFFIQAGNYKPEDGQKLLNNLHRGDAVIEIYNKK